jgi:hypothetical protein
VQLTVSLPPVDLVVAKEALLFGLFIVPVGLIVCGGVTTAFCCM